MARKPGLLIVDDMGEFRFLVRSSFGKKYQVFCAKNGFEALSLLRLKQEEIDIIILDINMPEMNGIQCLQRIRNESLDSHKSIIFLTGQDHKAVISEALQLKPDAYLLKPISIKSLKEKMEGLMLSRQKNAKTGQKAYEIPPLLRDSVKYWRRVRYEAKVVNSPMSLDFEVLAMNEDFLLLSSKVAFKEGSSFSFECEAFDRYLAGTCEYEAKVFKTMKYLGSYFFIAKIELWLPTLGRVLEPDNVDGIF